MKSGLRIAVTVLIVAIMLGRAGGTPHAGAQTSSLRDVDWFAAVLADPHVQVAADVPPAFGEAYGPYVHVDFGGTSVEGFPIAGDVRFGDIDGDGQEEAVIGLFSGGTAGETGFLIFHKAPGAPQLVYVADGYKYNEMIKNGRLLVISPSFVGFEPNCCPSAIVTSTYVLSGNDLILLNQSDEPNPVQEMTVQAYYDTLNNGDFADAYDFLSPGFQSTQPYDAWVRGFATTVHIGVQTESTNDPNVISVRLTAMDSRPNGSTVTSRFTGTWALVFNHDLHRWQMDRASIAAAP